MNGCLGLLDSHCWLPVADTLPAKVIRIRLTTIGSSKAAEEGETRHVLGHPTPIPNILASYE
jgi:hypothetical protein